MTDHLAIFGQCFADRIERLLHCGIDEAASVDDDEVCILVGGAGRVSLGAQAGKDQFGVDQRLGAPQRTKPTDAVGCEAALRGRATVVAVMSRVRATFSRRGNREIR